MLTETPSLDGREILDALPQALLLKSAAGLLSLNHVLPSWLSLPPSRSPRYFSPAELAHASQWSDGIAKDLLHFLTDNEIAGAKTELTTVLPNGHTLSWKWLNPRYLMVEEISHWQNQILHLQALSDTDLLTGLGNRRRFQRDFERVIAQTARGNQSGATLVVFDFDGFKLINDVWGHRVGDQVLADFGLLAKSCIRPYECLSRIGGDEFAILTQHSGMLGARRVQQAMSYVLSQILLPDGTHLEASFGFATVDIPPTEANKMRKDWLFMQDLMYAHADADLYKMKSLKKLAPPPALA
jgi:diguanylate cyclase (GGDEF)-like protein